MKNEEWYTIKNIDEYDTPALVVYPERALENIRMLKSMVRGLSNLRPHVKTHKMLEVARMMIDEGISKFKCATIAEAEMLGMAGAKDVLLSYQPVGPKIHRLLELVKKFSDTKYSCLVDNEAHAFTIGKIFKEESLEIPVFIDLNVGMNRTGVALSQCLNLYSVCGNISGMKPVGLHVYDGHIRDSDFQKRKEMCDQAFEEVKYLANTIKEMTGHYPLIVAGGSPTFPIHASREGVECSPGTFIFWDWGYFTKMPEQKFQFAALVVCRIISILNKETLCLDLGHKAVAADPPIPRVHFLNLPDAVQVSQNEEHLVVKVPDTSDFKLGDVFYGVPVHVCPTCALYDKALIATSNKISGSWEVISRNRTISI